MENKIESGVQLFSRINSRKGDLSNLTKNLLGEDNLQNMNVEIVSDYATDRNSLILDFIIRCILPTDVNPCWKNCGVIFINTTFQIGVLQVIKTIDRHLKDLNVKHRSGIIESSLKNLFILNCYDKAQLEITIYSLEDKIREQPNIGCLIFDDITSFYWIQKLENEMLSTYTYSLKVFNNIVTAIKGFNLFFLFGRTENNEIYHDKRLSQNVDYHLTLSMKDINNYEAKVQSYKSNTVNVVTFSYNNFKIFFN
ncbi:hypothetical protein WA026_014334 [Henosepilachna vigintioctopunctata]|uniref:Uncharacterized protein n=1 Tax=Henosepilachna vigintioctopunctata TaxID=420089 RepID=A0AAW1ULS7_9CUCU